MIFFFYFYNISKFFNSERLFGNSPTIELFAISLFKKNIIYSNINVFYSTINNNKKKR